MADLFFTAQTAEIALTAATTKTVLQVVAPTNQRLRIKRWKVSFDGISAVAEPVQIELVRQTTAGTMSALTPVKTGNDPETIQFTAQHTATVEPTTTDILDSVEVHPQSGYEVIYPDGWEKKIGGGGRLAIRCTAPAGVNVRALMDCEE